MPINLDDFNLESMGFDDFNIGENPEIDTESRNPISNVITGAVDEVLNMDSITNYSSIIANRSLPEGYGDGLDTFNDTSSFVSDLYDKVSDELTDSMDSLSDMALKNESFLSKILPESFFEKLRKRKDAQRGFQFSQEDTDEATITSALYRIFKEDSEQDTLTALRRDNISSRRFEVEMASANSSLSLLESILNVGRRKVAFSEEIENEYMKKSLELNFRQYFVMRDLLELTGAMSKDNKTQFSAMVKNTSLPDIQKTRILEEFEKVQRTKLLSDADNIMDSFTSNFTDKLKDNITSKIRGGVQTFKDVVDMGGEVFGNGMLQELDTDTKEELAGGLAMNVVMTELSDEAGAKLASVLEEYPQVRLAGEQLLYLTENAPFLLNELLLKGDNSQIAKGIQDVKEGITGILLPIDNALTAAKNAAGDALSKAGSKITDAVLGVLPEATRGTIRDKMDERRVLKEMQDATSISDDDMFSNMNTQGLNDGFIMDLLREIIPSAVTNSLELNNRLSADGGDAATYGVAEKRSIIEIIPGLLSRQLQQLTAIATGQAVDRLVFDPIKEKFVPKRMAQDTAKKQLLNALDSDRKNESLDKILVMLDPTGKLNSDQRNELSKKLLRDASNAEMISLDSLEEGEDLTDKTANMLKELVQEIRLQDDPAMAKRQQNSIARNFSELRDGFGRAQETITRLDSVGASELLADSGLLDDVENNGIFSRSVNNESLFDAILGNKPKSILDTTDSVTAKMFKTKVSETSDKFETPAAQNFKLDLPTFIDPEGTKSVLVTMTKKAETQTDRQNVLDATTLRSIFFDKLDNGDEGIRVYMKAEEAKDDLAFLKDMLHSIDRNNVDGLSATHAILTTIANNTINPEMAGVYMKEYPTLLGHLGKFIKRSGSGAGSFIKGYYQGVGKMFRGLGAGGKDLLSGAADLVGGVFTGRSDIYVEGSSKPALKARGLRNGDYVDAESGKTIRGIKDIKGTVKDRDGNIMLSEEEISNGLFDAGGGKLGGLIKLALMPFQGAVDVQKQIFTKMIPQALRSTKGLIKGFNDKTEDVHLAGSKKPILLRQIFKNGGYFSAKTGKPLFSHNDIDGDIKDANGNVILTLQQMSEGLYNSKGKPLSKGRFRDMFDASLSIGKGVLEIAKSGALTGYEAARTGVNVAGSVASAAVGLTFGRKLQKQLKEGGIGNFGGGGEYIEKIYNHMVQRWPVAAAEVIKDSEATLEELNEQTEILKDIAASSSDDPKVAGDADGDGDRDGGWRDILSRKKKPTEAKKEKDAKKDNDDEDKSFMSGLLALGPMLMGGLASLGSIMKGGFESMLAMRAASAIGDGLGGIDGPDGKGKKGKSKGKIGRIGSVLKNAGSKIFGVAASVGGFAMKNIGTAARLGVGFAGRALVGGAAVASGLISAPLLAIAGGAYIAYKVGSYIGSRLDAEPLEEIRFLQYGLDTTDGGMLRSVRLLEEELMEFVSIVGGKVKFTSPGQEELLELGFSTFDVAPESVIAQQQWLNWLIRRVIPVFLLHYATISKLDISVDLLDIDDEIHDEHVSKFIVKVVVDSINGRNVLAMEDTPILGWIPKPNKDKIAVISKKLLAKYKLSDDGKIDKTISVSNSVDEAMRKTTVVTKVLPKKSVAVLVKKTTDNTLPKKVIKVNKKPVVMAIKTKEIVNKEKSLPIRKSSKLVPVDVMRIHMKGKVITSKDKSVIVSSNKLEEINAVKTGVVNGFFYNGKYGRTLKVENDDGTLSYYGGLSSRISGTGIGTLIEQDQVIGFSKHSRLASYETGRVPGRYVAESKSKSLPRPVAVKKKQKLKVKEGKIITTLPLPAKIPSKPVLTRKLPSREDIGEHGIDTSSFKPLQPKPVIERPISVNTIVSESQAKAMSKVNNSILMQGKDSAMGVKQRDRLIEISQQTLDAVKELKTVSASQISETKVKPRNAVTYSKMPFSLNRSNYT